MRLTAWTHLCSVFLGLCLALLACPEDETSGQDGAAAADAAAGDSGLDDAAAPAEAGPGDRAAPDQSVQDGGAAHDAAARIDSAGLQDGASPQDGAGPQDSSPAADAQPGQDAAVGPFLFSGSVKKGPFVMGSSITVSPLGSNGFPTGQSFPSSTSSNAGDFEVVLPAPGPVLVEGLGYYFDELHGRLSDANLSLRAVVEARPGASAHVNLFTHLSSARVLRLIQLEGAAVGDAIAQAESELLDALALGPQGFSLQGEVGSDLDLTGADEARNAYVLALSAIFMQLAKDNAAQSGSSLDAELQSAINGFEQDLADDGQINAGAAALLDALGEAEQALPYERVMSNLRARVAETDPDRDLDLEPLPDINRIINSDDDGLVNADDNCDKMVNEGQEDEDGDGIGDACDFRFKHLIVYPYNGLYPAVCALHAAGSNAPEGSVECFTPHTNGVPSPHTPYQPGGGVHYLPNNVAALGDPPARAIAYKQSLNCANLGAEGVHCWNATSALSNTPQVDFSFMVATRNGVCGRAGSPTGEVRCWGLTGSARRYSGSWAQLAMPVYYGTNPDPVVCMAGSPPAAPRCYDALAGTRLSEPSGWPTAVSAMDGNCAVVAEGSYQGYIVCWTVSGIPPTLSSPNLKLYPGPYSNVATGLYTATCGILEADGQIECDTELRITAPGRFTMIDVSDEGSYGQQDELFGCGLTEEGWIRCFGRHEYLDRIWTPW